MRVKMSKHPPPAPSASAVGPCPTVIQIVGRPGTGSSPSTIAPPDHPLAASEMPTLLLMCLVDLTIKGSGKSAERKRRQSAGPTGRQYQVIAGRSIPPWEKIYGFT